MLVPVLNFSTGTAVCIPRHMHEVFHVVDFAAARGDSSSVVTVSTWYYVTNHPELRAPGRATNANCARRTSNQVPPKLYGVLYLFKSSRYLLNRLGGARLVDSISVYVVR